MDECGLRVLSDTQHQQGSPDGVIYKLCTLQVVAALLERGRALGPHPSQHIAFPYLCILGFSYLFDARKMYYTASPTLVSWLFSAVRLSKNVLHRLCTTCPVAKNYSSCIKRTACSIKIYSKGIWSASLMYKPIPAKQWVVVSDIILLPLHLRCCPRTWYLIRGTRDCSAIA